MKIISWNVNGIRSAEEKGLFDIMKNFDADCWCLQETKAQEAILKRHFKEFPPYRVCFADAERKGYSGVAIYTKQEPDKIEKMDIEEFDKEGRALFLTFGKRVLISAYFPNSQEGGKRLDYKLRFCEAMKQKLDELTASRFEVILCGDYNIAPFPIDLKNPKSNENNPGYLPEERAWMKQFLDAGYIDCFRFFYPEKTDAYTWWSYRFQARSKNIGWRIDFFCVNLILKEKLKACEILSEITGSDHCPIMLEIAD